MTNLKYSSQLSYAITHRDNAPIMMSEFIGATVDVLRLIYRPTQRGTPRWVAIAEAPGFSGIQISLFSEHIDLINFALGYDIKAGETLDLEFQAVILRWSKRRGFTGFGAVWQDHTLVWLNEVEQAATGAKKAVVRENRPVQTLAAVEKALRYAPYTLKRHFHSLQVTSDLALFLGAPAGVWIEMARDGDTAAAMSAIAVHAPEGLHVELVEMKPRCMVEWK